MSSDEPEHFLCADDLEECQWGQDFPLITCGTGCGKTSFVMKGNLTSYLEKKLNRSLGFVLVLVPTTKLRGGILNEYQASKLDELDFLRPWDDGLIRVGCFQKFAQFLADGNKVEVTPDLIVFDELDQLMKWSLCFRGNVQVFNYLQSNRGRIIPCGLTATPSLLLDYCNKYADFRFVDATPNYPVKLKAKDIEIVPWSSASTYLKTMEPDSKNKVLVYVRSAKECKRICEGLKTRNIKAGYIVSEHNALADEMKAQRVCCSAFGSQTIPLDEYVSKNEKLPAEIDVLVINDAMTAGCNIKDESVTTVVADTCELSIALQAKGRIRHNLDKFVWVYNGKEKTPCFNSIEEARPFLQEGANPTQEDLRKRYELESSSRCSDYLVYKEGELFKLNPVARAVYEYQFDILHNKLANPELREEYFSKLKDHSLSNTYRLTDAKALTAEVRKGLKVKDLNLREVFKFEDGQMVKNVAQKDMTEIAKRLKIMDKKGNKLGKKTFVEELNKRDDCRVSKVTIKRRIFYEVALTENVGANI